MLYYGWLWCKIAICQKKPKICFTDIQENRFIMKKKKKFLAGLLALGLSASLLFQIPAYCAEQENTQAASAISTNEISGWPAGPEITSTAAVVMEDSTNTILYAKNMDQPLYPAAAVKIMTILTALENSSLTDQVTITATGVSGATDGGANIAAQLDEVFTMEQCLYAIMLVSANDIAMQVAEHVGGSVEAFVEKMNTRASELGCTNTVFTNPTGMTDENQHTTARDMALIMKAAISNPSFRTIAAATSYTIPATNIAGGERVLSNNFAMMAPSNASYYQGCLGGKEGFTEASGSTLICAAERNGSTLIAVVLNGASGQTVNEGITVLDYGFSNFHKVSVGENDFNLLEGGTAVLPTTASASDVTAQDADMNGQILRTYLYHGASVGTAILENVQEDNSIVVDGASNMKEAKSFTENKSMVPYYVIGILGAGFLIALLVWMIKIIKS